MILNFVVAQGVFHAIPIDRLRFRIGHTSFCHLISCIVTTATAQRMHINRHISAVLLWSYGLCIVRRDDQGPCLLKTDVSAASMSMALSDARKLDFEDADFFGGWRNHMRNTKTHFFL